jgi:hypothetical protein
LVKLFYQTDPREIHHLSDEACPRPARRHRSEQYLTSSHTFSHFLRHENGR